MSNPRRPSLRAALDAVPSYQEEPAQAHDPIPAPLRDEDIPQGNTQPNVSGQKASGRRHGSGLEDGSQRTARQHVHRSLYASAKTIALIRRIAYENNTSAQELYREGLLLMLQKHGHYMDNTLEDI
jgi:hypothetical protein